MGCVRRVISYGMALELPHCARLHAIIAGPKAGGSGALRFETPRRRTVFLTARQVEAFRSTAAGCEAASAG
jgi:hypothetical protein